MSENENTELAEIPEPEPERETPDAVDSEAAAESATPAHEVDREVDHSGAYERGYYTG